MFARNMTKPNLTIVIPTHLRPTLLTRAVASALTPHNNSVEVLVVADRDPEAVTALASFADDPRLRLINNTGPGGASGARNHGVLAAAGDIVLFLDDDDELLPLYVERVLSVAWRSSWGFGKFQIRTEANEAPQSVPDSIRRAGLLGAQVPFRRKLAPLSAGFWVKRSVFLEIGGLCTQQTLDEDTDLVCRLLAAGHLPWFENSNAVILDRVNSVARLTVDTNSEVRAECYLRTFMRNAHTLSGERGAKAHLALRAQRMILRCGRKDLLAQLYEGTGDTKLNFLLYFMQMIKSM